MATRSEIIADTLKDLRVLGAGRAADADDAAEVGKRLDRIYAGLREDGLTNDSFGVWDLSAVPDELSEPLIEVAKSKCADLFHIADDRIIRLRIEEVQARAVIGRRVAVRNNTEPVRTEQF